MRDTVESEERTMMPVDHLSTTSAWIGRYKLPYWIETPTTKEKDHVENDHGTFDGASQGHTQTIKVLIPSPNKWNCFSIYDNRKRAPPKVISSHVVSPVNIMNTATPVSPETSENTNHVEQNGIQKRPSKSDSTDSSYRRLTLREKLARQRGENSSCDTVTSSYTKDDVTRSSDTAAGRRSRYSRSKTQGDEVGSSSKASTEVTEDKKVFGFKVMKGTTDSGSIGTKTNDQRLPNYSSRMREPRQGQSRTEKSESSLFYMPKTMLTVPATSRSRQEANKSEEKDTSGSNVLSKDKEVKSQRKTLTRAESYQEGKARLQEFREKQRRGRLSRASTVVERDERDSLSTSSKNISESLAEIRERIRERRRKKEELKQEELRRAELNRSQSLPERETEPKVDVKEQRKSLVEEVSMEKTERSENKDKANEEVFPVEKGRNNKTVDSEGEEDKVAVPDSVLHTEKNEKRVETTSKKEEVKAPTAKEMKTNIKCLPEIKSEKEKDIASQSTESTKPEKDIESSSRGRTEAYDREKTVGPSIKQKDGSSESSVHQENKTDEPCKAENGSSSETKAEPHKREKTVELSTKQGDTTKSSAEKKDRGEKDSSSEAKSEPHKREKTVEPKQKEGTTESSSHRKDKSIEPFKAHKESSSEAKTEAKEMFGFKSTTGDGGVEDDKAKKQTRRERRRVERYQRSKTMSAIMQSDIRTAAAREAEHKSVSFECGDNPPDIPSVTDIKKKFSENKGGQLPEPGVSYVKLSAVKKEQNTDKDKTTKTSKVEKHKPIKVSNLEYVALANRKERPRRHTLHGTGDNLEVSNNNAKKTDTSSGRGIFRRHTFNDNSTKDRTPKSPLKASESVEKLRERFSRGSLSLSEQDPKSFSLRRGSSLREDRKQDETGRRRVKSDSLEQRKSVTEAYITLGPSKGASLTRRHTIAESPTNNQDSKKKQESKAAFIEKYLSKGDEGSATKTTTDKKDVSKKSVLSVSKSAEVPKIPQSVSSVSKTKQVSKTPRSGSSDSKNKAISKNKDISKHKDVKPISKKNEESKEKKTKKEDKSSVSKLRQLFLGKPASAEKKTKLKDRRARTIAGGITPEMYKEIEAKSNKSEATVEPDSYLDQSTADETSELSEKVSDESEKVRLRRGSDLEPHIYISAKSKEKLPDVTFTPVTKGGNLPDVLVTDYDTVFHEDGDTKDGNVPESNNDMFEPVAGKDSSVPKQSLDDFLTSIKSIAGSPKVQRKFSNLPRGPAQKLRGTLSRDEDIRRHLNTENINLTHAYSTSDLDKLFYGGSTSDIPHVASEMELSSMDFDEISSSTTRLPSLTESRVKPKRSASKSLNPLKSLMERTDIRTSTEEPPEEEKETQSGFEKVKKRAVPRKKRSQIEPWRRHTLDPVALAALASREDFSRVSLRKTKGPGKEKGEFDGSLPVMLLQIKGRRQVQTRLVEPKQSSLNSGDCFILVTPKELFCWIGKNANTIEKAKAVEISSKIQKRGDMNCKTGDVLYIDEAKQGNSLPYKKFCKILEGETSNAIQDCQLCPDDEFYEREIISTNRIYKLQEADPPHLIPIRELTGHMPRFHVLNTKEVFVFDFGSEVYLWTGQQSLSVKRKVAFHLAQMVYKQPFKTDAVVDPINPTRTLKRTQGSGHVYHDAEGKECGRPPWTMFARLHEKAETILFQEKFFDWPDPTKIIKMKGHVSSGELPVRAPRVELQPCDVTEMQKAAKALEPVKLEETNLGRGLGTPNVDIDGIVQEGDLVTTLGMTVWLVAQNKNFILPKESEGHFHSGDGYVIRWVYFVAKNRVVKDRRGRIRPLTGRQRCAYFFWQGNECSVNEKGAAAIMAVELDEERGPQIRVVEGKEPPHFLKLFDGGMVIHHGKRVRSADGEDDFSDKSTVRMYCVRNEDTSEGCLVQVRKSASSLRSRSSFVVVDSEVGNIFVWHGCKANEYHRKVAEKAANYLKERKPIEVHLLQETQITFTEVEEGQEPEVFWKTVGGRKSSYVSLIKDSFNYDFSPRLFHLTSALGPFLFAETLCPSRYPSRTCPFPVLQDDLYSVTQPALFLYDVGDELYVWEGWMPQEITKDMKGSAKRRFDEERKLTLQTALAYVKEANNRIKKGAFVVHAGLEPISFTSHFPFWEKKQNIAEMKIKDGRQDCEKRPAKEVLETFSKKYYSLQELTSDNPPDGIDLSKMETYLTDEEFERLFEMKRDLFAQLPGWKQDILKKAFALF